MLEIHEKTDSAGYEDKTGEIADKDFIHIVESYDSGKVNGYGIYTMKPEELCVYDFECSDLNVCDGIVRTVLFKGLLAGINSCTFSIHSSEKESVLKRLGFISDSCRIIEDIGDFMGSCKNCKEKR